MDVSTSFFSVARYSGGATICGISYVYCPERDVLIQRDWLKYYQRLSWSEFIEAVKSGKKPILPKKIKRKEKIQNDTPSLFD